MERKELVHTHPGMKDEDFMKEIDATGGWPVGYTHVKFFHALDHKDRTCAFTDNAINTGYWTTVCSSDDYYWWKLSDRKKAEVMKEARRQIIRQLQ